MPANKNATTRYKFLDELLSNPYHDYSLDDLTFEVNKRLAEIDPKSDGVVRRTIEKDIYYLEYESPFLVDIERYSVSAYDREKMKHYAKQCLRYRDKSFSIFKKPLTEEEKYLLSELMTLMGQFEGLPNLARLENLRQTLQVNNSGKIISLQKNPLENTNLLGLLFTAISQKQTVKLEYHRFGEAETKEINLYPYLLKEYNRRWFVFGAAESDKKLLCFGLERIDSVTALTSNKYVEYDGDINEYFDDIIGVTNYLEKDVLHIEFWVSDMSKEHVATKPLHESQILYKEDASFRERYPNLKGGYFFSVDCKENYELIRELISFGAELVVLTPDKIVDDIYVKVSQMNKIYQEMQNLRTKSS